MSAVVLSVIQKELVLAVYFLLDNITVIKFALLNWLLIAPQGLELRPHFYWHNFCTKLYYDSTFTKKLDCKRNKSERGFIL